LSGPGTNSGGQKNRSAKGKSSGSLAGREASLNHRWGEGKTNGGGENVQNGEHLMQSLDRGQEA